MRNVDKRAAGGPQPDDGTSGLYAPTAARRTRHRRQAVVGVAGLVAVLGAGVFALAQERGDDQASTTDTGALAPLDPTVDASPSDVPSSVTPSPTSTAKQGPKPPTSKTPEPKTTSEQIEAAREAAASDGVPLRRPLTTSRPPAAAADQVKVTETGSLKTDKRTMKVVSARQDLTGYREMAWVADGGEPVGDGHCTQKIKLANEAEARVRPTLLLCWRTSATKSVYTVTVDIVNPPSKDDSMAAIDKVWSQLG